MYDAVFFRGPWATCSPTSFPSVIHRGLDNFESRPRCYSDPREIPIVPSPRRLYLRSGKTKSFPPCEGGIEFRSTDDDVAQSLTNRYRSALARGPGTESSRNKTINDFYLYSFVWLVSRGGEGGGLKGGPRALGPSPQWIMWEVSLFSLSRTPAARTNRPSLPLLREKTELCFSCLLAL